MYGLLTSMGVQDAICKVYGNTNPFSVTQAATGSDEGIVALYEFGGERDDYGKEVLRSGFDLQTR